MKNKHLKSPSKTHLEEEEDDVEVSEAEDVEEEDQASTRKP